PGFLLSGAIQFNFEERFCSGARGENAAFNDHLRYGRAKRYSIGIATGGSGGNTSPVLSQRMKRWLSSRWSESRQIRKHTVSHVGLDSVASYQNASFNPNWTILGSLALVIRPRLELPSCLPGGFQLV